MMSATYNNRVASVPKEKASAYCDVCFKKGLPESVFKSHFTKSAPGPSGVVTCPTILAASCRYCGKSGHWANEKHCPVMRADVKLGRRFETVEKGVSSKGISSKGVSSKGVSVRKNTFAVLDCCDDDDIELPSDKGVVVPVVPVVAAPLPKPGISWSDMARKPASIVPLVEETVYYSQRKENKEVLSASEKEALKILMERREAGCFKKSNLSWCVESDDEDDEEW